MSGPVIQLDSICLSRNGRTILDRVSWTVARGEHWALLGPNGSGKTTLLNIVTGYLWPMEGTVDVLGGRFGTFDIREMRRRIGLVSSALFERVPSGDTFFDIVISGRFASLGVFEDPTPEDRDRASEITAFLGCERIAQSRYGALSFGERQRALIGRALMAAPDILILDEPCEGLDMHARETLLERLDTLCTGDVPTLVLVTHRVEEIPPGVGMALVLKNGRVLASGPKSGIVTSEVLSAAMDLPVEILSRNGRLYAVMAGGGAT